MSYNDMNPTVKFVTTMGIMFGLAFFYNPVTPLVVMLGTFCCQFLFANVSWRKWALFMVPFGLTAIGTGWTTVLFGQDIDGVEQFTWFGQVVTDAELEMALTLMLRVLAFTMLSLLFILTTEPKRFIESLMQQGRVPSAIGYSALVGFRFFPILGQELSQLTEAHRLRGVVLETRWQRICHLPKLLVPMLAGAIRKAERIAFSMEARGFTGGERSVYHRQRIRPTDWMLAGLLVVLFGIGIGLGV